jgi:hypothetical protein
MKGTGPFYATGSRVAGTAGTTGGASSGLPTYGLDGQSTTAHAVAGSITASGPLVTVAFPPGLGFKSIAYALVATDATQGSAVTAFITRTPLGFSFDSVAGHVYSFYAVGT